MPELPEDRRLIILPAIAAVVIALFPVPALAQDNTTPSPLAPLKACQTEIDTAARLACYDRVVNELLAASSAGDLQIIDREEVRKTRRGLFGFTLPDFGIFGRRDNERDREGEAFDVLNTTISRVSGSHNTGYLITTAEGAVWQLDEIPKRLLSPKPGQPIEITKGALSAYYLRINQQVGVKGRRIR